MQIVHLTVDIFGQLRFYTEAICSTGDMAATCTTSTSTRSTNADECVWSF